MCDCDHVCIEKTSKSVKIRYNKRVLEIKYKIPSPKLKCVK